MTRARSPFVAVAALVLVVALAAPPAGAGPTAAVPGEGADRLPVVVVHGFDGSADQLAVQALRLASDDGADGADAATGETSETVDDPDGGTGATGDDAGDEDDDGVPWVPIALLVVVGIGIGVAVAVVRGARP